MEFKITGLVIEKESKRPVPGLIVRAFDKDLFYTDLLGNAVTAQNGTFELGYEGKDFQELFEKHPDIYLNIYASAAVKDPSRTKDTPIYSTKKHVRWNAGRREHFIVEIPHNQLGEDAPDNGFVHTPAYGKWKELIDDYFKEHPLDFQYNQDLGFMAPLLECKATKNFGEMSGLKIGDSTTVSVTVINKGNGISFCTCIETYEGPFGWSHPLQKYRLCDYKIITINPGETLEVKLKWDRSLGDGSIVCICYDPFLDPRGFQIVNSRHDHIDLRHFRAYH